MSFTFKLPIKQEVDGNDYQSIINKLYSLPIKVQFCHHLTTSFAAHKALDTAYESLNDLKDSIIEKLIGYSGERFKSVTIPTYSNYTEEMNLEVAKEIKTFGEELEIYAESMDYCDIENLAQEYSGVGAQLTYLLTLK